MSRLRSLLNALRRGHGPRLKSGQAQTHPDGERGRILVLTIGCAALAAALIAVSASASAVYLDRKELLALADATAAHAAATIDEDSYSSGQIAVTDSSVQRAASEFLASAPESLTNAPGLAIASPTGAVNGTDAQVTLVALSRPSFLPWVLAPWSDGIALQVTVTAHGG